MNMIKFILILFIPLSSFSQIVNIESLRPDSDNVSLHKFNFGIGVTSYTGTKNVINANCDVDGDYLKNKNLFMIISQSCWIHSTGFEINKDAFIHLRYNRIFNKTLLGELFVQAGHNELLRIRQRELYGIGIREKLYRSRHFHVNIGQSYMKEFKQFDYEKIIKNYDRLNFYASIGLNMKIFSIFNCFYYQPIVDNFKNIILLNELIMSAKLNKNIKMNFIVNYLHNTMPAKNTRIDNYTTRSMICINF